MWFWNVLEIETDQESLEPKTEQGCNESRSHCSQFKWKTINFQRWLELVSIVCVFKCLKWSSVFSELLLCFQLLSLVYSYVFRILLNSFNSVSLFLLYFISSHIYSYLFYLLSSYYSLSFFSYLFQSISIYFIFFFLFLMVFCFKIVGTVPGSATTTLQCPGRASMDGSTVVMAGASGCHLVPWVILEALV